MQTVPQITREAEHTKYVRLLYYLAGHNKYYIKAGNEYEIQRMVTRLVGALRERVGQAANIQAV